MSRASRPAERIGRLAARSRVRARVESCRALRPTHAIKPPGVIARVGVAEHEDGYLLKESDAQRIVDAFRSSAPMRQPMGQSPALEPTYAFTYINVKVVPRFAPVLP